MRGEHPLDDELEKRVAFLNGRRSFIVVELIEGN